MIGTPLDIKPAWFNPIRRLQSVAARSSGMAIVTMKFLVNDQGEPVQWTDPTIVFLEPKRDTKTILDLLTS
jgi:hypothetical protein